MVTVANNICCLKENNCKTCFNESNTSFSLSFIRLVDYLVTSIFHQMVVKAVAHVLSVLQSQGRSESDPAEVSRTAGHAEIGIDRMHQKSVWTTVQFCLGFFFKSLMTETSGDPSMFTTELVLDTKAFTYDPSEDHFQVSIQIVTVAYFVTVLVLHTYNQLVIRTGELFRALWPDQTNCDGSWHAHRRPRLWFNHRVQRG